tara:strand:+ start:248 stop:2440 length:2193 start_codon:yes stop_codon:yes gene_type:complete
MRKIIFRIFLVFIGILISFLIFISTIGIKTDKLNSQIINQIKVFDENLNLELKKVNIIFDPIKLRINLKTIGTNLIYKEKEIQLASIQSTISVKSFFKNQFSLTNLKISTKSIEIKNLLSFFRLFKNDAKIYLVEKLILKGDILGNIYVEFDNKGRIKDNFKIDGFVKNGRINTLRKYQLDKMNFRFNIVKNNINFNEISIYLNDNNLFSPELIVQKKKNKFFIKGKAYSKKISLNEKQIKDYIYLDNSYLAIKNVDFKINNEFSFEINQKYKIRNFTNNFIIDLDNLIVNSQYDYTNFFPKSQKKIEFQKHKLFVSYKKDMLDIKGSGDVLFQENNDKIKYSIKKTNKEIDFDIKLNILKNQLNLDLLNYKKEGDTNLEINLIGTKVFDGITVIEKALIKEKSNIFKIEKLIFNNDNKISKFNKLELNYIDSESIENQFSILKKNKNYYLSGKSFNANKLIDNFLKADFKTNKDIFKDNFKLKMNIEKTYLDKLNIVKYLEGYLVLENNEIVDANIVSQFSSEKKIHFTIKKNDKEKITTFFSDLARPFVKRYKFIKGFEDGSIDFNSVKKNNNTNSILKIYDFKLKELPTLTKVLTLASLQGIADLLSGEGIRFNEFEMNFSNENNLMKINEIYSIGPAISVLMNGYVENDKLISLRGTLVPATTLNKTIGSIPLIGEILVGKKVGEGVFGVSFKIKGPPNNLETTVNPIKTLTPRFITRTLEKIKKN